MSFDKTLLGGVAPLPRSWLHNSTRRHAGRAASLCAALLTIVLTLYLLIPSDRIYRPHPHDVIPLDTPVYPQSISAGTRRLVIILPVDSPSRDLCKVTASAVALGYPPPIIVNWKKDFHSDTEGIGPAHLGKVTGVGDFLAWALSDDAPDSQRLDEEDLVLVMDAYDVWLQLPPAILLQRYFASNAAADARLRHEFNWPADSPASQRIVVSAQKGCVAPRDKLSKLHCKLLPASTLPDDTFGFFTDWKTKTYWFMRAKFVNSGSFMGPAGDLRAYFARVKLLMDQHVADAKTPEDFAGDQGTFAEVFGEQEVWRRRMRKHHFPAEGALAQDEETFEHHLGLDYTQDLFYPTCHSDHDGFFVPLADTATLTLTSQQAGVSPPRINALPRDIAEAAKPLAHLPAGSPERARDWGAMPLYADFWTGAVPVAIHHNAWRGGAKERQQTWWDKTWYFPHLRQLLTARTLMQAGAGERGNGTVAEVAEAEGEVVARIPAQGGSLVVRPYGGAGLRAASFFVRGKVSRVWGLKETDWEGICRDEEVEVQEGSWFDEVFRDGLGGFSVGEVGG